MCRIVPVWLDALAQFGAKPAIVIPVRNPIEVAESLARRDGIAPLTSCLLWLRHVLEAERATRDVPRIVTTYQDLLDDWLCLAGTVALRTNLVWPRPAETLRNEIDTFIAPRLRHHAATLEQLRAQTALVDWVKDAFSIMSRLAQIGEDESCRRRLDQIKAAFDTACVAFAGIVPGAPLAIQPNRLHRPQPSHEPALSPVGEGEDFARLSRDLSRLKDDLERQNAELEVLSTELGVLRALCGRGARPSLPDGLARARATRLGALLAFLDRASSPYLRQLRSRNTQQTEVEEIRRSGLFDARWYLGRYPDVGKSDIDPLTHYMRFGAWEGRDPHPLFDQAWYLTTYPEATKEGQTPLGHFLAAGVVKGYDPNALFHTAWYVANNPDVVSDGINPLRHYMDHAAEAGRNPNPLFDSAWYLQQNPDVAESGANPLAHYIHHGIGELRDPHPLFDTEWYVQQYDHVAMSGMDALEHYLTIGALKGFHPHPAKPADDRRRTRLRARWREQAATQSDAPNDIGGGLQPAAERIDFAKWQIELRRKPTKVAPFSGEIGVFVHLFYENLAAEIASSLVSIPFDFKTYISTNSEDKKAAIEAAFAAHGLTPLVKVLPNRGWDVAPFVIGFADEVREHEICLKLHGKQSRYGHPGERGNMWRKHLLSGLLGHPANVNVIVSNFLANPQLGIAMAPHWQGIRRSVNDVGPNYLHMQRLLQRVGLSIPPDQPIEFPSGSMFWFRRDALAPLFNLGLTWADFDRCRPHDLDATIAHAIERCVLIFAAQAGFKWAFLPRPRVRLPWLLPRPNRWKRRNFRGGPRKGTSTPIGAIPHGK